MQDRSKLKNVLSLEFRDTEIEKLIKIENFHHLLCQQCYDKHSGNNPSNINSLLLVNSLIYCPLCESKHLVSSTIPKPPHECYIY